MRGRLLEEEIDQYWEFQRKPEAPQGVRLEGPALEVDQGQQSEEAHFQQAVAKPGAVA